MLVQKSSPLTGAVDLQLSAETVHTSEHKSTKTSFMLLMSCESFLTFLDFIIENESSFINLNYCGLIFTFTLVSNYLTTIQFCRVVLGELLSQFVRVSIFSWHIHVHLMSCTLIWHSIVAVRYIFTH